MAKSAVRHLGVSILKRVQKLVERDLNREQIGEDLEKLLVEIDQALKDKAHIAKCKECREAIVKTCIIINSQGW